jgi:8-oxo-dGTP pyrophosphatase MutT (NUDIX family)
MADHSQASSNQPTHAGGVVYREHDDTVEYLLVRARSKQREWVLPKGHIEHSESAHDAAVREVLEEAGVRADVVAELDTVEYTLREKLIRVRFYLMRARRHADARHAGDDAHDAEREHTWLPLEEARQRVAYDSYRKLLSHAERKRLDS